MSFENKTYLCKPGICLKPTPVTPFKYSEVYQDVEDVALFRLVNPLKQQWALYNDSQEFTMNVCVFFNIKLSEKKCTEVRNDNNNNNNNNNQYSNRNSKRNTKIKGREQLEHELPIRTLTHAQLYVYSYDNHPCKLRKDAEHVLMPTMEQQDDNNKKHNRVPRVEHNNNESLTKLSYSLEREHDKEKWKQLRVLSHHERQPYTSPEMHTSTKVRTSSCTEPTIVTVRVSISVKPHETVPFLEYDNPIDVEGAVMQIDVTLSECEVITTAFVGGWRRSDNALILKPESSIMPSYTNVYRCFPKHKVELLYRLVDKETNTWAFYNDTVDYKITVKMELDAESFSVTALDHTLVRCNDSQLFDRESTPEQSLLTLFSLPNEPSQESIYATNHNRTFTSCVHDTIPTNHIISAAANGYHREYPSCESDNKSVERLEFSNRLSQLHLQPYLYTSFLSYKEQQQKEQPEHHHHYQRRTENGESLAALRDSKEFIYSFPPSVKAGVTAVNKERIFELTLLPLTTERFLQGVPVNYVINFTAEPLHNENAQYERIPFVNGAPDHTIIDYDQLFSCFNEPQEGMLFRLVDTLNRCWGFYNDTTEYYFMVECRFPSLSLADVCEPGPETHVQLLPVKEKEEECESQGRFVNKQSMQSYPVDAVANTIPSQLQYKNTKECFSEKANKEGKLESSCSATKAITQKCTNAMKGANTYCETGEYETHVETSDTACAVVFTLLIPPRSTRLFLSGGLPQEYSLHFTGKLNEPEESKAVASTASRNEANQKERHDLEEESLYACYNQSECEEWSNSHENNNNSNNNLKAKNREKWEYSSHNRKRKDADCCLQEDDNTKSMMTNDTAHVQSYKLNGPQKSVCDYQRILPCVVDCNGDYAFRLIDNLSNEFAQWGFYNDMRSFDLIVIAKFLNEHDIFDNDLGPPIVPINREEVKLIQIVETSHKDTATYYNKNIKLNTKEIGGKETQQISHEVCHSCTDKSVCCYDNNNDVNSEFHLLNESFSAPVVPFYKPERLFSRTSLRATPSLSREQLQAISPVSTSSTSSSSSSLESENVAWQLPFTQKAAERTKEEVRQQQVIRESLRNTSHHTRTKKNNEYSKSNVKHKHNHNDVDNDDSNIDNIDRRYNYKNNWTTTFISVGNKSNHFKSKEPCNDFNNNIESEEMHKCNHGNRACTGRKQTWTAVVTVVKPGETKAFVKFKQRVSVGNYTLRYRTRLRSSSHVKVEHTEALARGTQELQLRYNSIISSVVKKDSICDNVDDDDESNNNDTYTDGIQLSKLFRLVYDYEVDDLLEQQQLKQERLVEENLLKSSCAVLPSQRCSKFTKEKSNDYVNSSTHLLYDKVISAQDEWKLYASHVDWALYNDSSDMCYIVSVTFNEKSRIKPLGEARFRKSAFTSAYANVVQGAIKNKTINSINNNSRTSPKNYISTINTHNVNDQEEHSTIVQFTKAAKTSEVIKEDKKLVSTYSWNITSNITEKLYTNNIDSSVQSENEEKLEQNLQNVEVCTALPLNSNEGTNGSKMEMRHSSTNDTAEQLILTCTVLPLQTVPFLTGYIIGEYQITIRADVAPENKTISFVNGLPCLECKGASEVQRNDSLSTTNGKSCKLPLLKYAKKREEQFQYEEEWELEEEYEKLESEKYELSNSMSRSSLRVYRVFSHVRNGLLFRIVDDIRQCWWFYNDTKNTTFKVKVNFYANSSFQVAGNAELIAESSKCNNRISPKLNNKSNNEKCVSGNNNINYTNGDKSKTPNPKSIGQHHMRLPEVNAVKEECQETGICNNKNEVNTKQNGSIVKVVVRPLTTELFITHADIIRFQIAVDTVKNLSERK